VVPNIYLFLLEGSLMVEEAKKDVAEVKETPQAEVKEPGSDGQIPQGAMLNIQDLQNVRALLDRVDLKGVSEANVVVTICAKIDAIVRAEAAAQKAAQENTAKENGGKK